MKLRTAALVVLAGFALTTCCLLHKRARRIADEIARQAERFPASGPEYWPIDEPWPAKDGPIQVTLLSLPPIYVLRSGRSVHGVCDAHPCHCDESCLRTLRSREG